MIRLTMAIAMIAAMLATPPAMAQNAPVQSLRGDLPVDELGETPTVVRQSTDRRFDRAYRQQPPLIPHRIEKYQVDLKVNQCLRCHDWPYNVEENAPKISETHYVSREGVALDKVARTRWFCTQCHVPQTQASSLVPNTFKSAIEVD